MEEVIDIEVNGEPLQYALQSLPQQFIEWQSQNRLKMFDLLAEQGAGAVKMQPAHIAIMATLSDGPFPVNLAARGLGLVPKAGYLEEFTSQFKAVQVETATEPLKTSLPRRVEVMRAFYADIVNFDEHLLGGLDIFEGQTAKNLLRDPRAALLYVGEAPSFPSYQFNGVITRVEKGDHYFEFLLAARELFAFDTFHIPQARYSFGYLFQAVEVKNKTPYPR